MQQLTFLILSVVVSVHSTRKPDQRKSNPYSREKVEKRLFSQDMINETKSLLVKELERYCRNKLKRLPELKKRLVELKFKREKAEAESISKIIEEKNIKMLLLMEVIKAREIVLKEQQQYIEGKVSRESLKGAISELKKAQVNYKARLVVLENKDDVERCKNVKIGQQ